MNDGDRPMDRETATLIQVHDAGEPLHWHLVYHTPTEHSTVDDFNALV